MFFFFQAEDGIRDLVRSRGLGDVYKRQPQNVSLASGLGLHHERAGVERKVPAAHLHIALEPVSYTHLTLPTSDLV